MPYDLTWCCLSLMEEVPPGFFWAANKCLFLYFLFLICNFFEIWHKRVQNVTVPRAFVPVLGDGRSNPNSIVSMFYSSVKEPVIRCYVVWTG